MSLKEEEQSRSRSVPKRDAHAFLLARERVEEELARTREAFEEKSREMAWTLAILRATLDATTDAILVTDPTGRIVSWNARYAEVCGVAPEVLERRDHRAVLRAFTSRLADPDAFLRRVEEIYATSAAETYDVFELRDGRVLERFSRLQSVGDTPAGRVWSIRDITVHKRAQEEQRQQREWFRVTLSSIADAVITTDSARRVTFLNPVAERMTGWNLEEAAGRQLDDVFRIFHEQSREPAFDPLHEVMATGVPTGLAEHTALVSRKGQWIPIEDSAAPIRNAGGVITGAVIVFHDVTERRRSENALRQSQERLKAALVAASTGTFFWDFERDLLEGDENFERLLGGDPVRPHRSIEEFITCIHPGHRQEVLRQLRARASRGGELVLEFPVVLTGEEVRWLRMQGRVLAENTEKPTQFAGACVDITERKRSEHDRFRLAALVESSDDAIVSKSLEGTIQSWNRGAERMFGYSATEVVGRSITVLIPQDRHDEEHEILAKLRRGERIESYETIRLRKDGRLIDVALTVSPIRDSSGEVIGASKIARDVTARKRTETALRDEYAITEQINAMARALATELDLTRIGQIVTDAGRRLIRAEAGAFYLWPGETTDGGYVLQTVSGLSEDVFARMALPNVGELFALSRGPLRIEGAACAQEGADGPSTLPAQPAPPVRSWLAVPISGRSGQRLGGLLFAHSAAGVFTERDERIIAGVAAQAAGAMDIARLYRAERHARRAAEEASKAKDLFLAALSHELRTPLTPALAILSSLTHESHLPPEIVDALATVRRNVELEARLIDDLLDLTRITHGKLNLQCELVALGRILDDVIVTCRPDLKEKGLTLDLDVQHRDLEIYADGARIMQVLWNLLKNAIKFTPGGGRITLRTQLVDDGGQGRHVVVEVEDTGIGIEPQDLERVFEAFEQGNREMARQFGGLGLGLAISRAIASFHRGTLTARSEGRGRGSTFTLRLPLVEVETSPHREPTVPSPAKAPAHPRPTAGRILLVEDHEDSARALATILRRRGYDVALAGTVADGIRLAGEQPFDVVMSDLGLPDGTGYDLMRQLRATRPIPAIALSGYAMEEDVQKCFAAGFSEHLVKPVPIAKLQAALDRLLGARAPGD